MKYTLDSRREKSPAAALHREHRHDWLANDAKHSAAYLEAALEAGEPDDLKQALRDIAEAWAVNGGTKR